MVTVSCRGLITVTFAAGIGVLSSRTCVVPLPAPTNPDPKTCTPHKSFVGEINVPCGKIVLGIPLTMGLPGLDCGHCAGGVLGTTNSLICADLMGAPVNSLPKSTISIVPLPDFTTNARLLAGSTASPPKRLSVLVVPFCTVRVNEPEPESLICAGSMAGLTVQAEVVEQR